VCDVKLSIRLACGEPSSNTKLPFSMVAGLPGVWELTELLWLEMEFCCDSFLGELLRGTGSNTSLPIESEKWPSLRSKLEERSNDDVLFCRNWSRVGFLDNEGGPLDDDIDIFLRPLLAAHSSNETPATAGLPRSHDMALMSVAVAGSLSRRRLPWE
jgi:hypothetical protein